MVNRSCRKSRVGLLSSLVAQVTCRTRLFQPLSRFWKMNSDLELELIDLFVRKSKRERLKMFAAKPKTRDKLIREFNSPGIFNPKLMTEITGAGRTTENLLNSYRKNGMGEVVYVISENYEWDGQEMATKDIIQQSMAMCTDVFGYCAKSKTAFYEWHHSGASYFLATKSAG